MASAALERLDPMLCAAAALMSWGDVSTGHIDEASMFPVATSERLAPDQLALPHSTPSTPGVPMSGRDVSTGHIDEASMSERLAADEFALPQGTQPTPGVPMSGRDVSTGHIDEASMFPVATSERLAPDQLALPHSTPSTPSAPMSGRDVSTGHIDEASMFPRVTSTILERAEASMARGDARIREPRPSPGEPVCDLSRVRSTTAHHHAGRHRGPLVTPTGLRLPPSVLAWLRDGRPSAPGVLEVCVIEALEFALVHASALTGVGVLDHRGANGR